MTQLKPHKSTRLFPLEAAEDDDEDDDISHVWIQTLWTRPSLELQAQLPPPFPTV